MDRELMELEHKIMESVWVGHADEVQEYLKTMTSEEAGSLMEKPFPAFEGSFLAWSLRKMLGME